LDVLSEERVVVGDAVTEALKQKHSCAEVLARQGGAREGGAQPVAPELLVATAEEPGPEPEGDAGDDAAAGDQACLFRAVRWRR
jgi:hypothetical protein